MLALNIGDGLGRKEEYFNGPSQLHQIKKKRRESHATIASGFEGGKKKLAHKRAAAERHRPALTAL